MSIEIFKDIEGYPGYQISNLGRVKSFRMKNPRILKTEENNSGYVMVALYKDKQYYKLIHRLMCIAFLPNPDNLPCVNHKDENKHNNFIYINDDYSVDVEKSNLEWCSVQYNNTYNGRNIIINGRKKGTQASEETRMKMRASHKKWRSEHPMSDETKQKIREARIHYWEKRKSINN